MFVQKIERNIFSDTDFTPVPAWIYWMLMLAGAGLGITMFLKNGTEVNIHPIILPAVLYAICIIMATAMMNAVIRSNGVGQMAGRIAFILFGGALLVGASAILSLIIIALAILVFGIWVLGTVLSGATASEATVESGGFFGGTKKVLGHENLDGSFTDLQGKTYRRK